MSFTVMAYAEEGYQEFRLPDLNDSDYHIILDRQIFGLSKDLTLPMEIMDNQWRFLQVQNFKLLTYDGKDGAGRCLENEMVMKIRGIPDRKISLVMIESKNPFSCFEKYRLDSISQITIGKNTDNTIVYDFRGFISRNHAVMYRYNGDWVIQDTSSNGTYINGRKVNGQEYLNFGDQITLFGLRLIYLGNLLAICSLSDQYKITDSDLTEYDPLEHLELPEQEAAHPKKEYFKRSPRTIEELYTDEIGIEAPPALNKTKKRPLLMTIGPSLTMALPMMMGCLMAVFAARNRGGGNNVYMFTGVVTAVSSAVIGVIWALTNLKYTAKEEEEAEVQRFNAYSQYLIEKTDFIKQKYEENKNILFRTYLSGQECCNYSRSDLRLWNHNEHQDDFMTVRLGTGTIPFQAEINIPKEKFTLLKDELSEKPMMIKNNYSYLYSVPVCIDVQNKGLIGIIGGKNKGGAYQVAYNIIAQLAANNSYTEVKMAFFYHGNRENQERFAFAKWLPHVWMEDKKTRLIATNKTEIGDVLYEIAGVIRKRTEDQQRKVEYPLPHFILFVNDRELLEGELLENHIYRPRSEYGITTFLLSENYGDLPNSCEYIIQNDGQQSQYFHVFNEIEPRRDLVIETVSKEQLETLARLLSDIEVNEISGTGEIPDALDFFEMYGVQSLEQLNVIERWKKNRNYETMRVPIGQKNGGNLCYLDIHEKYHGPHGLVAGTTGSGKSETLQTYILSLAVNFSPDDIAFFIIDFKGGGMANLFSGLPHMAGQISNLSGNQVRRAMISIKSENQRRQRLFAENDVNNINLYTRLYKNHEVSLPIPHLFIIIDEFAELKREEPEFMKELISVAQVGRSLGVHLILATQKPSGTVDDNIWSNSKFRICLRVQDKQDSNDMLHKPDAAYITQAGRGYLQVGSDEIYEQFQSGYSGADYNDDPSLNQSSSAIQLTLTGKEAARGMNFRRKNAGNAKSVTQLDAVIAYLDQVADRYQYDQKMLLWLPVLPEELYLDQLEGYAQGIYRDHRWHEHAGKWSLQTIVGLYDDPVHQAQKPLCVSFSDAGHLAVCGTVATGKSTFLQTLLYGMIHRYTPQELNFYVLDYSGRLLLPFEHAPHCGGVIIDTDEDKVKKFFFMMNRIIEERKNLFGGGNYSQYIQAQRSKGASSSLPAILVVIDNYSNFREKTNCLFDEDMIRLSREGVGYGIYLVLTSAGFGSGEIPTRVGDNMQTVISLEMGDKFKYAEVLRTTRVEILPEANVKGRGLAYVDGAILEFQTALSFKAEDMFEMNSVLQSCCEDMAQHWDGAKARRVPMIPEHPVFSEFVKEEEYQNLLNNRRYLPFAYLSEDASVYSVDLWNTYCYIIQGRGRTGKKNVMKALLYAASKQENARTCVIDLKGQEFKMISAQLQVEYLDSEQGIYDYFKDSIPVFKERNTIKRSFADTGMDSLELAEQMSSQQQVFIFVADMVDFIKKVYQPSADVGSIHAYLENITEKGSYHGFYFIGILDNEQAGQLAGRTLYNNMISYKTGIHLGGNVAGQRLFQFGNIPYKEQSRVLKPGTGYAANPEDSASADAVVLPLVKGGF